MGQYVQEKPNPARVPLGAFVDAEQHRALAELAASEDRSLSAVVRLALADYLDGRQRRDQREQMLADAASVRARASQYRKIETMEAA